jgi:hypothetical protein
MNVEKNIEIARRYGYTEFDCLLGDVIGTNGEREWEGRKWFMSKPGDNNWYILPDYDKIYE